MKFDPKYKPELCMSKDETRPHLCHVELDTENKKMIAMDGHRLITIPVEIEEGDTSGPLSVEALIAARKVAKNTGTQAEIKANGSLKVAGATFDRADNGYKFPPWRQIVPEKRKITIRFNAKYLAEIAKAMGTENVALAISEDLDPILVYGSDGSDHETAPFAVLMPCRK